MKRILLLLIFLPFLFAEAQTKDRVNRPKDGFLALDMSSGWFVGASVGAQAYFGAEDQLSLSGKYITPAFSIYAGKWILPYIGLRLGYDGFSANSFSAQKTPFSSGEMVGSLYRSELAYNNLHFDLLYNLSERVCKYNPKRVYSAIPYLGLGIFQMWKADSNPGLTSGKDNDYSINIGLINRFRITENLSANLELQAIVLRHGLNRAVHKKGALGLADVITVAKVGVSYCIGRSKFSKGIDVGYVETLISDLNRANFLRETVAAALPQKDLEIESKNTQIEDLKKEVESMTQQAKSERVVESEIKATYPVFFACSSHYLNADDKKLLFHASEAIKSVSNQQFLVSAYADPETGNPQFNQKLSDRRAKAVYDLLVNQYGVNPDQLSMKANGQNNCPHKNFRLNRVVLVEPVY